MFPVRTILCPTDFSAYSEAAFQAACSLARDNHARLIVLHVVPMAQIYGGVMPFAPVDQGPYLDALRDRLSEIRCPVSDSSGSGGDQAVGIERLLAEGDPTHEILRVAEEVKADLIVMGSHGRGGLAHMLLGSVAESVLRRAPCPVLTVKSPVEPAEAETPRLSGTPAMAT